MIWDDPGLKAALTIERKLPFWIKFLLINTFVAFAYAKKHIGIILTFFVSVP